MELIPKPISDLATQGTGWLLFVSLLAFTGWLLKRHLDCLTSYAKVLEANSLVLRENGEAVGNMAQAVKDRTPAFDNLSQVVIQQQREYDLNNTAWRQWADRTDASLAAIQQTQSKVQRALEIQQALDQQQRDGRA